MKREENSCNNSSGIASVVLGIIGSVFGILVLPIILSIIGLVFGIIQYKKEKNNWALWGIGLSILGIIIALFTFWKLAAFSSQIQQTMASCQANPAAPGCADLLKLAGIQ